MIAISPHAKYSMPRQWRYALVVLYQFGVLVTAGLLTWLHWGRCAAVFNCMVLVAADLFRALLWPLYWLLQVVS